MPMICLLDRERNPLMNSTISRLYETILSNMLEISALIELLVEKGIITNDELVNGAPLLSAML